MSEEIPPSSPTTMKTASLAFAMSQLGFISCDAATLRDLLATLNLSPLTIKESHISKAIGMMCQSCSNNNSGLSGDPSFTPGNRSYIWNVDAFVNVIHEEFPKINWLTVMQELDYSDFFVPDTKAAEFIVHAYQSAVKDYSSFPIHLFFKRWNNVQGQLSFIRSVAVSTLSFVNIANYPKNCRLIIRPEDISNNTVAATNKILLSLYHQLWNSQDLFELLFVLVDDSEMFDHVRPIIETSSKQSTELLCLALSIYNPPFSSIMKDILVKLVIGFLIGGPTSHVMLPRLWIQNPSIFILCMAEMHRREPTCISRLLDIVQDLKILNNVLDSKPSVLTFDLASLASRREHLNLEKWLSDSIKERKDTFIRGCLDFLAEKVNFQLSRQEVIPFLPLPHDILSKFFKAINNAPSISAENADYFVEIQSAAGPNLSNLNFGRSNSPEDLIPSISQNGNNSFSPEVEEESNAFYEKVYSRSITLADAISILTRLRNSSNLTEQQIFACMINNLFDEYRFLPKYPDKELSLTGVLFGNLITFRLVAYEQLGIALKCVLEALRKPVGSKMFKFGIQALLQFQTRLVEWPLYCSSLLQIPHLFQAYPDIIAFIKQALIQGNAMRQYASSRGTAVPAQPSFQQALLPGTSPIEESSSELSETIAAANSLPLPSQKSNMKDQQSFVSLNASTLVHASDYHYINVPNSQIKDKILFLLNNISIQNLETKSKDIIKLMSTEYFKWFSQYLVIERVSIEPNYHQLYLNLLDELNLAELNRIVLSTTYSNLKILLYSEKTLVSTSERSLLKNLGSWLGGLTLAKDKPILHRDLSLKGILLQAFDENRLIVAIPFVCKVLEAASKSRVFKPINPWLQANLKLLSELYKYADIKLNLKFEIEVLCKALDIDVKDIEPTDILKSRTVPQPIQTNHRAQPHSPSFFKSDHEFFSIPQLSSFVVINPMIQNLNNASLIKFLIIMSIEFAVREVAQNCIEKAVNIASVTTHDIIIKDFIFEPNEEILKHSAMQMMQNLTGNLTLVTAKEPLKLSILSNLKSFTALARFDISDALVQTIAEENIDLACAIVEKAAIERATSELANVISASINSRKNYREKKSSEAFVDQSVFINQKILKILPSVLIPPKILVIPQQHIYDDFARMSRFQALNSLRLNSLLPLTQVDFDQISTYIEDYALNTVSDSRTSHFSQEIVDKIMNNLLIIESIIKKNPAATFSVLSGNQELKLLMKTIMLTLTEIATVEEALHLLAQKLVQLVTPGESNIFMEFCVILIQKLCSLSASVNRDVLNWILYSDDEKRLNARLTKIFFARGLINVLEYDSQLQRHIEAGHAACTNFAIELIRLCVLDESATAPYDFAYSLEALARINLPKAQSLIKDIFDYSIEPGSDIYNSIEKLIPNFVMEWKPVVLNPYSTDKVREMFMTELATYGIYKSEDSVCAFFSKFLEASFVHWSSINASQGSGASLELMDTLAVFIVTMLKYYSEFFPTEMAQVSLLSRLLSLIGFCLNREINSSGGELLQKPFCRLLSSLFTELNDTQDFFKEINTQILYLLSQLLHIIQPNNIPRFSFGWFELVGHRCFLSRILELKEQKGWNLFVKLLEDMLSFVSTLVESSSNTESTNLLYTAVQRIFLLLLHDYPDFLCLYYQNLVNYIPHSCIQIRNMVLTAYPHKMVLPDPFTPNLKVDLLPETQESPRYSLDPEICMAELNIKAELDVYLSNGIASLSFMNNLKQGIFQSHQKKNGICSVSCFVLYVTSHAVSRKRDTDISVVGNVYFELFQRLLYEIEPESRELFLNSIVNQLRYPNSHTFYISCLILGLFLEDTKEFLKEHITRILLERLTANRPHPWGLLITFIELIKNPIYNFWNHSFTQLTPDVDMLFDTIAHNCMVPRRILTVPSNNTNNSTVAEDYKKVANKNIQ